jgi:hypothetical protein
MSLSPCYPPPTKTVVAPCPSPLSASARNFPPPLPGQPGPFSLGAEGVLEGALRKAGFQSIQIHRLSAPLRMASAAECIRFERESFGAFNQLMAHLPRERRETIWDEAEVAMQEFEGPDGFLAPCEPLVAAGAK